MQQGACVCVCVCVLAQIVSSFNNGMNPDGSFGLPLSDLNLVKCTKKA